MQRRLLGDDHPQVVRSRSDLMALLGSDPRAAALLNDVLAPGKTDLPPGNETCSALAVAQIE